MKQCVMFVPFAARYGDGASDLPFTVMMAMANTGSLQRVGHAILTRLVSVLKGTYGQRTSKLFANQVRPCSGIDQERQSTILQLCVQVITIVQGCGPPRQSEGGLLFSGRAGSFESGFLDKFIE